MNMLPVELRVKQLKLNLVYNVINDKAPKYMSNLINVACKQHGINTRSSVMSLCVPYVNHLGKPPFTTQEFMPGTNCHFPYKVFRT